MTASIASVLCALCGAPGHCVASVETLPTGRRDTDLDTRGAPRQALLSLQYCDHCGYCTSQLARGGDSERRLLASEPYQRQLVQAPLPVWARRFLCMDLVAQQQKEWQQASWACIQAAWACDDQGQAEQARQCRLWALNRMASARAAGLRITHQPGSEILLQLDLLRRSGRFQQAQRLIERSAEQVREPNLQRILRYQQSLVEQRNDRRHDLGDLARWETVTA